MAFIEGDSASCHWTSCDDRIRLTNQYNALAEQLKRSANALTVSFQYRKFLDNSDEARKVDEDLAAIRKARKDLDEHRLIHGC